MQQSLMNTAIIKQKLMLEQKICQLQQQLEQFKQKQHRHKRLNESIIQTYKDSQTYRQSHKQRLQKDLHSLSIKHKQQVRKLKTQYQKQKQQIQKQNKQLKLTIENLQTKIKIIQNQTHNQNQQIKKTLQNKYLQQIKKIQQQHQKQIIQNQSQINQLMSNNHTYQQYIQRKIHTNNILNKENHPHFQIIDTQYKRSNKCLNKNQYTNSYSYLNSNPKKQNYSKKSIKQNYNTYNLNIGIDIDKLNYYQKQLKIKKIHKPQSINELNRRLNRAMSEINQNRNIIS